MPNIEFIRLVMCRFAVALLRGLYCNRASLDKLPCCAPEAVVADNQAQHVVCVATYLH